MPQYEYKKKFAWRPILTTSGKWIWWRHYVKLMKFDSVPSLEPITSAEYFTEDEWLLENIKNDYSKKRPPPPPKFFKSAVKKRNKDETKIY